MIDAGVLRHHKADATLLEKATNRLAGAVLQHFHNHAFTAPFIVNPVDPRRDTVAVKHLAHLTGRQEQVAAAVIGNKKPETILMADDATGDEIRLFNGQIGPAPVTDQLTITAHGNQPAPQGLDTFFRLLPELLAQGLMGRRRAAFFEMLENEFPALDGIVVLLRLTTGVRIIIRLLPGNHSDPCPVRVRIDAVTLHVLRSITPDRPPCLTCGQLKQLKSGKFSKKKV